MPLGDHRLEQELDLLTRAAERRLAASKIGVPDYKSLAQAKLRTAEDLYRFLIDQFHQSRTFVLESVVVLILLIELVYVFHGKM